MTEGELRATETFLHQQIPMSAAMGVRVTEYTDGALTLTAPLEANHNHLGTAFGGSLGAVATLAGYALLWLELNDRNAHIVIRESTISYARPVTGEIRAICRRPEPPVWNHFQEAWALKPKARVRLAVTIAQDGEPAVLFSGTFVALR